MYTQGLHTIAIVFDGTNANKCTATYLGCDMSTDNIQSWFLHPSDEMSKVYIIFDVCHMLKLVRNLIGDLKKLQIREDGELNEINWKYMVALNDAQEKLGFTFANKLKRKHLLFVKNKMKVSLAAQTLSASVASAIDFLRDEEKIPEFEGSEATTKFIRIIDKAFDMLNSRHPLAKGFKAPVHLSNLHMWLQQCEEIVQYLLSLRDKDGILIHNNRQKTCIWGFVCSIHSLKAIAQELLTRHHNPLKYVLTYKFSQDHIELLFSKIRLKGGHNNNPTVIQLKSALRSILIWNSIEPSKTGNCTSFQDTLCEPSGLLGFTSHHKEQDTGLNEVPTEDNAECEKMMNTLDQESPNELLDNILYYIGGHIVQKLLTKVYCTSCRSALLLNPENPHGHAMSSYPMPAKFTVIKQKGGLIFPSVSVLKIIKAAEIVFKRQVVFWWKRHSF